MTPYERNCCTSVREFQKRFAEGEFEDGSFDKQCEADVRRGCRPAQGGRLR